MKHVIQVFSSFQMRPREKSREITEVFDFLDDLGEAIEKDKEASQLPSFLHSVCSNLIDKDEYSYPGSAEALSWYSKHHDQRTEAQKLAARLAVFKNHDNAKVLDSVIHYLQNIGEGR